MPDIPIVSVYPQTFLKVSTLYHGTDGAAEAHGSEGTCPGCPGLCGTGTIRPDRLQSSCGFQNSPRKGQNPRQMQSLKGYQVARESHRRREKDRNGKRENPLQSGLCVSELNGQRGLERGTDEVRSLET